jgi:hypothetical protein
MPITAAPNLQVNPSPGVAGHSFDYCPDEHFYDYNNPRNTIQFWKKDYCEWVLDPNIATAEKFDVDNKLIKHDPEDTRKFWVCKEEGGILRVRNCSF